MQTRYSLRFESGERKGETVPLSTGRTTVGRKPGNTLQISDGSVSGQHAELIVDELGGLRVRDLGSTNGTTVGGERAEDASAAHGDRIGFGSVHLTLVDRELSDAPAATAGGGEVVGTVRAEQVAQAGRRSRAGLLFGLALLLAIGGGAWTLFGRGGGGGGGGAREVREPAGNLLAAGYSFEDDAAGGWESDEEPGGSFQALSAARVSGALGMRAELDADTGARLLSDAVPARVGQTLRLSAELRGRNGAGGRAGIRFLRGDSSSGPGPLTAWGPWISGGEGFESVELAAPVPPGATRARAVIEALAGAELDGSVDVDDVALVPESGGGAPAGERDDYQLFLLGEPPQTAAVYKLGRPLFGELEVLPATAPTGAPSTVALAVERQERWTRVSYDGVLGAAVLSLRLEPAAVEGDLATMGPAGHRPHGPDFEREEATGLLIGSGVDVIALRFDEPVTVRAEREGAGARVRVELGDQRGFVGQLDFSEERKLAGDLAHEARTAEREGRLGAAMAIWGELLEKYPFEKGLVNEAEEVRGRLSNQANEALIEAREAYERGQYFGLVEMYRTILARVDEIIAGYAGSEIESEARELAAAIQASIEGLLEGRQRTEAANLESILATLQAAEAPGLAGEVRGELSEATGDQN